jgi:Carboxypeptidase regulatory-like domain
MPLFTRHQLRALRVVLGILALALFFSPQPAWGQFTTASLGGTILDSTGAAVPDAVVSVLNVATGFAQDLRTSPSGAFLFSRLPIGTYQLRIEKSGFNAYVQDQIVLTVDQTANLGSITLQIGQVSDAVTVTGTAELISTRTATGGQLIGEQQIVELPLQGRRPERLMYLAAGTVDLGRNACRICGQGGVYPGEETAGVNGTGQGQVQFQLDATSHNDTYLNTSLPFPNPDAVQEFNLQSSNFTAEYGNAGGGIVNVVVKSGTNDIHGTMFHFLRNGAWNARQFFAPTQDTLKRNQSGGSVGGPIVKSKLFYFGTFQATRIHTTPAGLVQFVPTEAQRRGDFSAISTQLVDPVTRQPLVNNQIPANRISPVAQYYLKYVPLPNGEGGRLTFPGTPSIRIDNQLMGKVDYVARQHQINGRYFFTDYDEPVEVPKDNLLAASNQAKAVRVQNISINHTYTASPTMVFNTTFGMVRQRGGSLSTAPFGMTAAGVKIIGPEDHPEIDSPPELIVSVTGGFNINTNHLGDFDRGDFTFRHVATKVAGNHELRFGGEAVRVSNHLINTFQMAGRVAFNGSLSGNGLADFMFGRSSEFRQGGGEFKQLKGIRWGAFIQDNWNTNQRLTLNLGFRWDPYLSAYDRQGRVICFQPGSQSRRYPNAPNGLLYGGDNPDPGCPQAGVEPIWTNFGPRLGLAYRLTNDGRTTLRVGAGYFYTPERTGASNGQSNTAPFGATFTLNDVDWTDPYGSKGLANPFPANFGPGVPGPEFVFAPINNVTYWAVDRRIPQIFTYSLRVERQFAKNWMAGIALVGNRGKYLSVSRQENPAVYIPGASTVGNTQDRRVFKNYGTISRGESNNRSLYNSLQLNLEKRFSHGFSVLANYVWSKTLEDAYGPNPFDLTKERALSGDDVPHNLKFSNVWELPRAPLNGVADKILNGWQLNAIAIWQSGFPFGISSGRDNSFTGGTDRGDFSGGGSAQLSYDRPHSEMIQKWFDTSKFAINSVGTFGNTGRNFLRGPRYFNTDLGLLKVTKVGRLDVQFRAEAFNVFNNVNFQLPNNNVSSAQFGQITAVVEDSQRILQFGLKVAF